LGFTPFGNPLRRDKRDRFARRLSPCAALFLRQNPDTLLSSIIAFEGILPQKLGFVKQKSRLIFSKT